MFHLNYEKKFLLGVLTIALLFMFDKYLKKALQVHCLYIAGYVFLSAHLKSPEHGLGIDMGKNLNYP